ncbi:MAG: hypothetical protein WBX15_17750 [Thermoanaerobaculia bacterium]
MSGSWLERGSVDRAHAVSVVKIIWRRLGRASAISMHAIRRQTGIPTREIQSIVKWLVEERSLPIGTSPARPWGYYWISTEDERRKVRNHFIRRALSTLEHAKAYDRDSIVAPLVGQLKLISEEGEHESQEIR